MSEICGVEPGSIQPGVFETPPKLQREGWEIDLAIIVDDDPLPCNVSGLIQTATARRRGLSPALINAYMDAVPKTWGREASDGTGPLHEMAVPWQKDGIEWTIRHGVVLSVKGLPEQEAVMFGFEQLVTNLDLLVFAVKVGKTVNELRGYSRLDITRAQAIAICTMRNVVLKRMDFQVDPKFAAEQFEAERAVRELMDAVRKKHPEIAEVYG